MTAIQDQAVGYPQNTEDLYQIAFMMMRPAALGSTITNVSNRDLIIVTAERWCAA
jgi:hypothetical protein